MEDNWVPEWATEIAQFWLKYTTEIALAFLAVLAVLYALKNYANGWKWKRRLFTSKRKDRRG